MKKGDENEKMVASMRKGGNLMFTFNIISTLPCIVRSTSQTVQKLDSDTTPFATSRMDCKKNVVSVTEQS